METRTVPRPTCLACSSEGKELYVDLQDRLFGVSGTWVLKKCANVNCGLAWLDPTPIESDIPQFYINYFTHKISGPKQWILFKMRSFFYGGYTCITFLPSALLGLNQAKQAIQQMFLQDMKPGKLLDVGCGGGVFLHRMLKFGWSVAGVDFDPKAVEHAKMRCGSDVFILHSDLERAHLEDDAFHAITLSHVIEHAPDPIGLLAECKRILKPGGRIVVTTPNIQSSGHKRFRDCWWGLDSPRHLQIFSPAAIRECALKAGFMRIRINTTAANADTFMGGSFGFEEAKKTGDCASGSRVKINFLRGLRSLRLQYKEAFQLRRDPDCGEELVLICEK